MPLLGAHMSIAGGLHLAFDRLNEIRGAALQIFTTNHRQWRSGSLSQQAIALYKAKWKESGRIPVASHDIYLINLAATDEEILARSILAFAEEMRRCSQLGVPYLIMHPGAHLGEGLEAGLDRFTRNLDYAIEASGIEAVSVLIENTAGQGSSLGSSFEEISYIISTSRFSSIMGVCYDTCHGFAAGYDIRDEETFADTFSRFDQQIGLERLKFFHLNDSKRELGSRVDRHEHIGKGKISLEGFRHLLNHPQFRNHPMVLETPKGKDLKEDKENMKTLQSLLGA
ncbi:MAG: deoxyribonuclease IV [Syntrophobacteraceae bacterium]